MSDIVLHFSKSLIPSLLIESCIIIYASSFSLLEGTPLVEDKNLNFLIFFDTLQKILIVVISESILVHTCLSQHYSQ
jgi:hypothetical protein